MASPSSVTFTAQRNDSVPDPQEVEVTVSGSNIAYIAWDFADGTPANWLTVAMGSGYETIPVSLSINDTSLDLGVYETTIRISIYDAGFRALAHDDIAVSYQVIDFTANPATLVFSHTLGTDSPTHTITLGGGSVDGATWTAEVSYADAATGWMSLDQQGGTIPATSSSQATLRLSSRQFLIDDS